MKNEKKEENETTQANKMGRKTITGNTHTKSALLKLSQEKVNVFDRFWPWLTRLMVSRHTTSKQTLILCNNPYRMNFIIF